MRYFLPILLLLLTLNLVSAQEESPFPVLNAEDIFAEGVTVLERLPVIEFDRENRLVYYFNPETSLWTSYPYPDEVIRFNRFRERSNGTFLLQFGNDDNGRLTSFEDEWLFDPQAGSITRDNLICGRIAALPNEGEWFLHQLNTGLYILCDSETGQHIILPENLQSELTCANYPESSSQSPNQEWIILYNCSVENRFFAINLQTQEIRILGQFERYSLPKVRWLDNDSIAILDYDDIWGRDEVYIAEANKADSLIHVGMASIFQENQVVWYETQEDVTGVWYRAYRYDSLSDEKTVLLDYRCGDSIQSCLGNGFALLSPDSVHLAMVSEGDEGNPIQFLIFNTHTQELVIEIPFGAAYMGWFTNNSLVVQRGNNISVIDVNQQEIIEIETPIEEIWWMYIFPDISSFLVRSPQGMEWLYSEFKADWYSIINSEYRPYTVGQQSGDIVVKVISSDCQQYPCFGGSWRIRIDALSGENS